MSALVGRNPEKLRYNTDKEIGNIMKKIIKSDFSDFNHTAAVSKAEKK